MNKLKVLFYRIYRFFKPKTFKEILEELIKSREKIDFKSNLQQGAKLEVEHLGSVFSKEKYDNRKNSL